MFCERLFLWISNSLFLSGVTTPTHSLFTLMPSDYRAASFLRLWHSSIHPPHTTIKIVFPELQLPLRVTRFKLPLPSWGDCPQGRLTQIWFLDQMLVSTKCSCLPADCWTADCVIPVSLSLAEPVSHVNSKVPVFNSSDICYLLLFLVL